MYGSLPVYTEAFQERGSDKRSGLGVRVPIVGLILLSCVAEGCKRVPYFGKRLTDASSITRFVAACLGYGPAEGSGELNTQKALKVAQHLI